MAQPKGLWIFVTEDEADAVERAIESSERFTTVVSSSKIGPKTAELCLVSLSSDTVDYLGISLGGQRVVTGKKRISVANLVGLRNLPIAQLKKMMGRRFASKIGDEISDILRISPKLWQDMVHSVAASRSEVAESLKKLRTLITEHNAPKSRIEGGLEVFERDAVASALEVFAGPKFRKRILRSAGPAPTGAPAPFLSRLTNVSLREDPQISHDAVSFPGMEVAKKYQVGAVELENERGERLTIMNCNRQPLEHTLGVDLIYYNHTFDSFVLVQYKRMTEQAKGKLAYRPDGDASYAAEIERMKGIEELIDAVDHPEESAVSAYRLSNLPFYFKLCEPKTKNALDEGMVSGMYLPIELWNRFLASAEAKGKRGGISIGWHNCHRKFTNSEFTKLLHLGWIGSAAGQSKVLSDLIESIIQGDRMLIVAATTPTRSQEDPFRDMFGRYASEDDPHASR